MMNRHAPITVVWNAAIGVMALLWGSTQAIHHSGTSRDASALRIGGGSVSSMTRVV